MENSRRQATEAGESQSGNADDSMDWLSDLPPPLIHHILSFLDTKSAIQTSVLSRRWKCTWKHLSVLEFHNSFGRSPASFKRYVEKVLSLRYDFNLSSLIFNEDFEESDYTEQENSLVARVIRYALSHGTQHLGIYLQGPGDGSHYRSADLLGFNSDCSLQTLNLFCFSFSNSFRRSGFLVLEKLTLFGCAFFTGQGEVIMDLFSNLPCLKDLFLADCSYNVGNDDAIFRISSLQLLSLRLGYIHFCKMEIYAPKLKYFSLHCNDHRLVEFTELTVPSLDHAEMEVAYEDGIDNMYEDVNEYTKQCTIPLLHGLRNATSLVLCSLTVGMLGDISDYLEDRPSPFTRLKSLTIDHLRSGDDVPFAALNYLLKGSSNAKPVVKFKLEHS